MDMVQILTKKLNSGHDIPVIGYGTWVGLNNNSEFLSEDVPKLFEAMKHAIDIGYRHIDTAHLYRVEGIVGKAVQEKISEEKVKREDMFITTKVWNHMHAPKDVEKSARDSLERLNMDYVDLLLLHWPMSITADGEEANIDYLDTWKAMEAVQAAGLARSIGVSNFNVEQLKRLLQYCTVKPAMNQVELNLNLGQDELVEFCNASDIALTAYTPFGTLLPTRSLPDSPEPKVHSPAIVELIEKYKKSATQIALRYLYQRGIVSIPKTLTKSRALENASIFDFVIQPNDVALLKKYNNGYRTVRPSFWQHYNNYPFDRVVLKDKINIPKALLKWDD